MIAFHVLIRNAKILITMVQVDLYIDRSTCTEISNCVSECLDHRDDMAKYY